MALLNKRVVKWLRVALILSAAFLILLLLAFVFIQTPPGKRILAAGAARVLTRVTGQRWDISGMHGLVPFDVSVDRIAWSDERGELLSVDNGHVAIAAGGFLRGAVHFYGVSADRVLVRGFPKGKAKEKSEALEKFVRLPETLARLPETLRRVRLDHLEVKELEIAEEAFGQAAAFTIEGAWRRPLDTGNVVSVLKVEGLGDTSTSADVRIENVAGESGVSIVLHTEDETFLPGRLPWPEARRLAVSIETGAGADDAGTVQVVLNDVSFVDAHVSVQGGGAPRLVWDGAVHLDHPLMPFSYANALGTAPEIALEIEWPRVGRIALQSLKVSSDAINVDISGSFDSETEALELRAVTTCQDLNRVAELPKGVFPGPWDMKVDAGGTMQDLTGTIRVAAQSTPVIEGEWSASFLPGLMVRTGLRIDPAPEIFSPELEALGVLKASLEISEDERGVFHIPSGLVEAKGARVEFDGLFNPRERAAEASARGYVEEVGAFKSFLPVEVDGDISARGALRASDANLQATMDISSERINVKPDVGFLNPHLLLEISGTSWWNTSAKSYEITSRGGTRIATTEFTTDNVTYALQGAMPSPVEFRVSTLEISDGNAVLNGVGGYHLETGNGEADISLRIADVARLPGQIARGLGGVVQAAAALSAEPEKQSAGIELDVTGVSGLPEGAGAVLGDVIHARATADRTEDGVVWKLTALDAGALNVSAEGIYAPGGGRLSGSSRFAYADLSRLEGIAGTPLMGAVAGTGDFSFEGGVAGLHVEVGTGDVSVGGWRPEAVRISGTAAGPFEALEGTLSLGVHANGEVLESTALWAYADTVAAISRGTIQLDDNTANLEAEYDTAARIGMAKLEASLPGIVSIGRFANLALEGAATVAAELEGGPTSMRATGKATAESLQTPWISSSKVVVSGNMQGDWVSPVGEFQVILADARAGEAELAAATLTASGDGNVIAIQGSVEGVWDAVTPLTAEWAASLEDEARLLTLERFEGQVEEFPFVLANPAKIRRGTETWAVRDFVLNISDSQVSARGDYAPESIDVAVVWNELPLALGRLAGTRPFAGVTSGELSLTGSARTPAVAVRGEIEGLRLDDGVDAETPSVHAQFEGHVHEGFGSIEFSGDAGGMLTAKGRGRAPLYFGITPWTAALPEEGPLDGAFEVKGDLGVVSQFFPNDQHVVEGPLQGRFDISGTLTQPLVNGEMRVTGARYENLETSTILDEIEAVLEADGDLLELTTFTAQTIPSGTVNVDGQCALDPSSGFAFSAEALFEEARLVNRDDLSADLGGTVTVEGSTAGVRVGGDVTVAPAYFRLPEQLPARVGTIEVQEKNVSDSEEEPEAHSEPALPITVDVRCVVPGRFYVMGNGLDSEWEGELKVKGTPQRPEVIGDLRVRRGELLFLNRRLELKDSSIAFDGSTPISPYFDIWGTTRASDLNARVHIYGNLSAVELDMESDPPLPEDQVLARLLFDRDLKQLSPIQALQLARTGAALSGGGFGLGGLPTGRAVPFADRMQLKTGEKPSDTALGVGKYLGERAYVEIEQGIGPESSKVSVELELTPNLSVGSEVESDAQSSVGVFWKKDY